MKCETCKTEPIIRKNQRYYYVESGLDNVYLDGIDLLVCELCGEESPVIPRILDVHASIGRAIALQQSPLRGSDIRFLRKQLGMRARVWAGLLRVSVETLSRWENEEQKIGPQSDALFRLMYIRICEEREGRLLANDIVDQITSVPMNRTTVPVLLVDANTTRIASYLSLDEMLTRYEKEMEEIVATAPHSHSIPAGSLQRGRGFVPGTVISFRGTATVNTRRRNKDLQAVA